jgi:UDP-N-acetylglucosamine:LPS N-acetylglucosamine transferase
VPDDRTLDWQLIEAPDGLDAHMATCSFALTVFGVSLLELLKYGVPTVVFSPYGNANDTELEVLRSTGACCVARSAGEAVSALAELMANESLARSYRTASMRLLASAGPQHLAKRLIQMIR